MRLNLAVSAGLRRKLIRAIVPFAALAAVLAVVSFSQAQNRRDPDRPLRLPVRGVHGSIAAGSEYATEAGMLSLIHI